MAGGSAGSRGPDEPGNGVSATAAHAGGRRSGLARQTPGARHQSAWSGTHLAGDLVSAASPCAREGGPGPARSTLRCADQRDPPQSGPGGAHRSDPKGGENQPGTWQDGAGGLLLLAAAEESNLLATVEAALPIQGNVSAPPRLARATTRTRRQSLLTLLFLGVVGLRRHRDLRGYAQEGLALLTTRRRAYGYHTVERFLSQIVQAGGAEPLTDALARWTTLLWKPTGDDNQPRSLTSYVDGHRKPVFSDELLPRGVIGRTGKILGCRALFLFHDEQGHPSLSTTHRGDLHLTLGTPSLITRYETATREGALRRLVIDREGMAAEFLATLAAEGHAVVTILRDSAV